MKLTERKLHVERAQLDRLLLNARDAGLAAVGALHITPMVINGYAPIADGVCGFAWVNIRPGNGPLARYLKLLGFARPDSYLGGVSLWVSEFNQSLAKKEAYAFAFAKVLQDAGVRAYAGSRID